MKKLFYIFTIFSLAFAGVTNAQIVYHDDKFEHFEYNVKLIDEFILRFNLKELLIQPDQSAQYERDNRMLLFDKDYYLANEEYLSHFLDAIEKQHTSLSFYDSTWYAIAECNVTMQGKKDKLTLVLRTEQVKDDLYKWSIIDARGKLLELTPKTTSDKLRMLPTDNEVNFIALQSVTTTNAPNITLYNIKTHVNDRLSVFNSLVYYKLLKVDNVQKLTYCFTQVKGYKFFVTNFAREADNAGWLIYDVQKDNCKSKSESANNDNTLLSAQQKVSQLYQMLSEYAKNPRLVTLARTIKSQFQNNQNTQYFFGAKHIYDDIDVYINQHSPLYAYVSIGDYLNSIENLSKDGMILSYQVSNLKIVKSTQNNLKASYKLCIYNNDTIIGEYYATATINNDLFVNIIPVNELKGQDVSTIVVTPTKLSFGASGGTKILTVNTSREWSISIGTASWGHLTKSGNTLTLRVDANTSTVSRTDFFKIKAGDREERIFISQQGQENNQDKYRHANISKCWLTHNLPHPMWNGYMMENVAHMRIHCQFEVNGYKGEDIKVCAFFCYANGNKVQTKVTEYATRDGQATVQGKAHCDYEDSRWNDYYLDIPYSVLPYGNLSVYIQIYNKNGDFLAESNPLSFTLQE